MKGKIDKDGYLWKEVPGGELIQGKCMEGRLYCSHHCVAFEGPLPEKECAQVDGDGTICPGRCEKCELHKPTGRTEIHYCKGILKFDGFVDERVPK